MEPKCLKAAIQEQFDNAAHFYLQGSQMADQDLLDRIVRLAEPRSGDWTLDVACGAGFLTCKFASQSQKAVGVDLSTTMLAEARKHALALGLANTDFQPGDGEALPYGDGTFNIVTCKLAFHYFPNPMRAVTEMKRVTKSGGRLVLIDRVASEDRKKREYHNQIEKLRTPSKVRVYSTSEIVGILEGQGLSVDRVQYYEQQQDFEEWLITTGAPVENRQRARELMIRSLEGDSAGLKARLEGGRVVMSHLTAIIVARNY